MLCGHSFLAEDCSIEHLCPGLGGTREPASYRAPCPSCQAPRRLSWWAATDRRNDWRAHCSCPRKDVLSAIVAKVICLPAKPGIRQVSAAELSDLALATMPPMSMRLAMLELAGMSTSEALDMLEVRREHRARVIAGRTNSGAKPQVRPRTKTGAPPRDIAAPKRVQNRRSLRQKETISCI